MRANAAPVRLENAAATEALGARLAEELLRAAGIDPDRETPRETWAIRGAIHLRGELGAGKTTLVRGLVRRLGFSGPVKSPTYTLVEPYVHGALRVYHFDLYRLGDPEELELLGARDYFEAAALVLVEWPERARGWLPAPDLELRLAIAGEGREVTARAVGGSGATLAAAVAGS